MNEIATLAPSIQVETCTVLQIWQADEFRAPWRRTELATARVGVVEQLRGELRDSSR
jgi:hypothetical protein